MVWHLRVGDIRIHSGDTGFFKTVWDQLEPALGGAPTINLALFDGIEDTFALPPGYGDLATVIPNLTPIPTSHAFLPHAIFEAADVVVSSGSSFAEIGPLVSGHALLLQHRPKHANRTALPEDVLEYCSDTVSLHPDGLVFGGVHVLRQHLLERLCRPERLAGLGAAGDHLRCPPPP